MKSDNSRNFPTSQEIFVGNFLLAGQAEKSDKSAMPSADKIRTIIQAALAAAELGSIGIITQMRKQGLTDVDRTYLRDFLTNKKRTLSYDFSQALADFLGLDVKELRVVKTKTIATIRSGAKVHLYISEHMQRRGLDDELVANRLEVSPEVIKNWRDHPTTLIDWQVKALLHALDMESTEDLAKPPPAAHKGQPAKQARRASK